ncbi:MAG: hypothetical protein A2934_02390 [Candidatus Sungbacteria bacterium RIFCSPLOWO2_01_FULL_47_10]|uniref:Antitoxin n=1 Tax=Candidatus Sungbacteria bacterium RIFCSPLOWO2_01_FULL_47_10 TaxID=1802276 RepID=A0A1G2L6Y9_9BACT|nr:MAG: hypothetical protein A2934_02390 [Candidatus Sungbacteria bacterium RIFCSPLOWO2_01_FULL_47_10]
MFDNFKNLIRRGEKFIMVEGGKPVYVVMSYEDYEGMLARRSLDEEGNARKPLEGAALHGAKMETGFANERPRHHRDGDEFTARFAMDTPNVPEDISKIRLEDLPL